MAFREAYRVAVGFALLHAVVACSPTASPSPEATREQAAPTSTGLSRSPAATAADEQAPTQSMSPEFSTAAPGPTIRGLASGDYWLFLTSLEHSNDTGVGVFALRTTDPDTAELIYSDADLVATSYYHLSGSWLLQLDSRSRLINIETEGSTLLALPPDLTCTSGTASADGQLIALACEGELYILSIVTGDMRLMTSCTTRSLPQEGTYCAAVSMSPDGSRIAYFQGFAGLEGVGGEGMYLRPTDCSVDDFDCGGSLIGPLTPNVVGADQIPLAWSPTGTHLAAPGDDQLDMYRSLRVIDAQTGDTLQSYSLGSAVGFKYTSLVWDDSQTHIALAGVGSSADYETQWALLDLASGVTSVFNAPFTPYAVLGFRSIP